MICNIHNCNRYFHCRIILPYSFFVEVWQLVSSFASESPSGTEDRPSCFYYKGGIESHNRVCLLASSALQILQERHMKWERIVHSFSLSFGHIVFLRNCLVQPGFLVEFLCPSHTLPCDLRKTIFRLTNSSRLTSKIDKPCLSLQLFSKSMLMLLGLLNAFFFKRSTCVLLLLFDDVFYHSPRSLVASRLLFRPMYC